MSKPLRDTSTFKSILRKFLVRNAVSSIYKLSINCYVNEHLFLSVSFIVNTKTYYEHLNLLIIRWIVYIALECILYILVIHRFYVH
jgi:hypothetical protein